MAASLEGQLVVAISSRALFDFEEENQVFEQGDDRAYMKLQLERLEEPAKPGVAFSLVKKLLAFNDAQSQRVEVVILSRNDPVSGMRVFRSAQHYGLPIQRGSFTRGQSPWRYLKPLNANLFLSTHLSDVRAALDAGVPAAQVYPHSAHASEAHPHEVRIAFDGDAVLFVAAGVPVLASAAGTWRASTFLATGVDVLDARAAGFSDEVRSRCFATEVSSAPIVDLLAWG